MSDRGPEALDLIADVRDRLFGLNGTSSPELRVGMEVEVIPVRPVSGERVLPEGPGGTLELLGELADRLGWEYGASPAGAPRFHVPDHGDFSFEPGGQIEFSSAVFDSVDGLTRALDWALETLFGAAEADGVRLLTSGIDDSVDADSVPLVLTNERYSRMAEHLARFGPAGRRMMRQTAAIHLNLELGENPLARWNAANRLVPYFIGIFANSATYAGRPSGHRSFRAHQWKLLDPARSGIVSGADPVEAYAEFALKAPVLFLGEPGEPCRPMVDWIREGRVDEALWRRHLSTLFPEVRPRGYLEIRCIDALPPSEYAAPLVFATGLLYDDTSLEAVLSRLPAPTDEALERSGRVGMQDPSFRRDAVELWNLAFEGAERLGREYLGPCATERARDFFDRHTARDLDPAAVRAVEDRDLQEVVSAG